MIEKASTNFPEQIKILPLEKVKETATESHPDLILWSDGSRLANGQIGAGVAWQGPQGNWLSREILLGIGKEVFDAELSGACNTLEIALRDNSQGPVTVMLDSQAAITRLSHQEVGQGQHLALRAHQTVLALKNQKREMTIQ